MKRNSKGQGHLTNKNGKQFEKIVLEDIKKELKLYESIILNVKCFKNENNSLILFEQSDFYKYAQEKYQIDYKIKTSKKFVADLWIMKNEIDLYLIEVKSQTSPGSTDEKINSGLMLDLIYKDIFNDEKFNYKKMCYITNDFFNDKRYQTSKDILKRKGIEFYIHKLDPKWIKN